MSIDEKMKFDFESYLKGDEPAVVELARAPVIDMWEAIVGFEFGGSTRRCMKLRGQVTGHPQLPDGDVTTSPLVWMDRDFKWGRTTSRLYRLGDRKISLEGVDL